MVGSARVIQAVVVSPTTSLQVLKRLALSRRYSWETVRIQGEVTARAPGGLGPPCGVPEVGLRCSPG
jgi:hypothetical protein